MMFRRTLFVAFAGCAATQSVSAQSQTAAPADSDRVYDKTEVMIPMRDGVRLNTMILTPRGVTAPLPIIMLRTPYGIAGGERSLRGNLLAREGYIFAFQDLRGRFASEGQFVMMRPLRDKNGLGSTPAREIPTTSPAVSKSGRARRRSMLSMYEIQFLPTIHQRTATRRPAGTDAAKNALVGEIDHDYKTTS